MYGNCKLCVKFDVRESLPTIALSITSEVFEYLFSVRLSNDETYGSNSFSEVSISLILKWTHCNVYPTTVGDRIW